MPSNMLLDGLLHGGTKIIEPITNSVAASTTTCDRTDAALAR